ncbi:hypothetical protein E4T39_01492 [Aureobasidium subglaciale]|nr:hypothetical protein E4T39_01492 [Aureobasidium subglaciale]
MSAEDLGTRELGQVRTQRLDEKKKRNAAHALTITTIQKHIIFSFHITIPPSFPHWSDTPLLKLLNTLRLLHSPSANSKLGIPALDKLLATHTPRFDPTNLSSIPAPAFIEITSPGPKSGKTELFHWIIANLVLGSAISDVDTGVEATGSSEEENETSASSDHVEDNHGKTDHEASTDPTAAAETPAIAQIEQHPNNINIPDPPLQTSAPRIPPTAIALLTSTPISIPRLAQIILHHLQSSDPSLPLPLAQETVHKALDHIHIFSPPSLTSLIATITSLPAYFLALENKSRERRLGALILDSGNWLLLQQGKAKDKGKVPKAKDKEDIQPWPP